MAKYTGNLLANQYVGTSAADDIDMRAGDDTAYGQGGDDVISGGWGNDSLHGGNDDDLIFGNEGNDFVFGDAGDDHLHGNDGDDLVHGGTGRDLMFGEDGNDRLFGDEDNDTLDGGVGADLLDGGDGDHDLADYSRASGSVTINLATNVAHGAEAEGDTFFSIEALTGSRFADTLTGSSGDESFEGLAGADRIDGGGGADTAFYTESTAAVNVNLATGLNFGGDAAGDVLINIENLVGSVFADVLTGDAGANTIEGNPGNDVISGGAGADTLRGGAGNDTFEGGAGADLIDGGSDFDTASYANSAAGVTVNLATGVNTGGDAAGDVLVGIESLVGSSFLDFLTGGSLGDTLNGGGGDDVLLGGGGSDILDGGTGSDAMAGGTGGDTYKVDAESDSVIENANEGNDTVLSTVNFTLAANVEDLTLVEGAATAINGAGNAAGNRIVGNSLGNALSGFGGTDTLIGGGGSDLINGGAGSDVLQGDAGNDTFVFAAGEANGDIVLDFAGNVANAGDSFQFVGFGTAAQGATFTQIGTTNVWQIHSGIDGHNETMRSGQQRYRARKRLPVRVGAHRSIPGRTGALAGIGWASPRPMPLARFSARRDVPADVPRRCAKAWGIRMSLGGTKSGDCLANAFDLQY